ncbi:IBR domain-containing protein [Plasmodiophora brassicae]
MCLQMEYLNGDDVDVLALAGDPLYVGLIVTITTQRGGPDALQTDDQDDSSNDERGELEGRHCIICMETIRGRPAVEDRNHEPICRRCEHTNIAINQITASAHPIRCSSGFCMYMHTELMQMLTGPRHESVRKLLENSTLQRSMERRSHCPAASCDYQAELEAPPAENRPAMVSCPQCETVSCNACDELWRAGDLEHFDYTYDEVASAKQDGTYNHRP